MLILAGGLTLEAISCSRGNGEFGGGTEVRINPMIENANRKQEIGNLDSTHGEEVMNCFPGLMKMARRSSWSPIRRPRPNTVIGRALFDGHIVIENIKGKFHV